MAGRQFILDTETTGLKIKDGHRIIEIGCLEMIDRKLTGRSFHHYFNPEREVDAGAIKVHGIDNAFLQDKALFREKAQEFIDLICDAELIIHNAPFDIGFLNHELALTGLGFKAITDYCKVLDTLALARKMHVGQKNNLDALCKRYGVDNKKRDLHGALLDARLLAEVYLAMTSGQSNFFDSLAEESLPYASTKTIFVMQEEKRAATKVILASQQEMDEHARYLAEMRKLGPCLWIEHEAEIAADID